MRDVPLDVQRDLDEAYREQQLRSYGSWGDLYEQWYKRSSQKSAQPPDKNMVLQYDAALARHLPDVARKPWADGYKYSLTATDVSRAPTFRIYLNTTPQMTAEVLAQAHSWAEGLPGFLRMKVGNAEIAHTSRDVIVIYVSEESYEELEAAAISLIGRFHRSNRHAFVAEVPRFTKAILEGVSIGREPSIERAGELLERYADDTAQGWDVSIDHHTPALSFSTYRAWLIFEALSSPASLEDFRSRAAENLGLAGIDVAAPYLQRDAPSARILYRLGLVYRRIQASVHDVKAALDQGKLQGQPTTGGQVAYCGYRWDVDEAKGNYALLVRTEPVPESAYH